MSLFSLFSGEKEKTYLLLAVESGAVSGALVAFPVGGGSPSVLVSAKVPCVVLNKPEKERLLEIIRASVDELCRKIIQGTLSDRLKKRVTRLSGVEICFASPWYAVAVRTVHIGNERTFLITENFIQDVLQKEAKALEEARLAENLEREADVCLEHCILKTEINGYAVEKSVGKKATVLDITAYFSFINGGAMEIVTGVVSKHFHVSKNRFTSSTFPISAVSAMRKISPEKNDYVLMNVAAEVIDFLVVRDGVVTTLGTLPSGSNFVLRQISKAHNVPVPVAESMLKIYMAGKLDQASGETIAQVLDNVQREWLVYFESIFIPLAGEMLPRFVYILAEDFVSDIAIGFLKKEVPDTTFSWRKVAKPIVITPEMTGSRVSGAIPNTDHLIRFLLKMVQVKSDS